MLATPEEFEAAKLPVDVWKFEAHDKSLLRAVSENGLNFLNKMKGNAEWGFSDITLSRKVLVRRVEQVCFAFKKILPKYKRMNESKEKGGNLSTGQTKIEITKKFTRINVERDLEGNIVYPIVVSPTLQILNLGVVDYERSNYHSEKNIFPVGWKSLRRSTSMFELGKTDTYICEILDGGSKPLFKVTAESDRQNPIMQSSSSGVWIQICTRINEL